MRTTITPWFDLVVVIVIASSGGFSVVQIALAGIGIMSAAPSKRADAVGRIKWILIGTAVSLGTFVIARVIGLEASTIAPHVTATAPGMTYSNGGGLTKLPGVKNGGGLEGWIVNVIFYSLTSLFNMLAEALWTLSGFTGPTAMINANIQDAQSHGYVMGIFPETTWTAMMYMQHALFIFIAVAAVISFAIQGIQIQNAPSSSVARERAVGLVKSVVLTGIMLGATPYLLGLANAGVSDVTAYVQGLIVSHTHAIAKANPMVNIMFSGTKSNANEIANVELFSGNSLLNSIFALIYSAVNLVMWIVYQWRRVVLAFLITLMPLFYIGFVTGRKPDLAVHWWKEVIAYMFIPFVVSLLLLVAQVFIGI